MRISFFWIAVHFDEAGVGAELQSMQQRIGECWGLARDAFTCRMAGSRSHLIARLNESLRGMAGEQGVVLLAIDNRAPRRHLSLVRFVAVASRQAGDQDRRDNGIIAILIGKLLSDEDLLIDTWLMSCRVLGRQVEPTTLNLVAEQAQRLGARKADRRIPAHQEKRAPSNFHRGTAVLIAHARAPRYTLHSR